MIAKFYLCSIENNSIVIGIKIVPDFDVVAVIAPKWRHNAKRSDGSNSAPIRNAPCFGV